MYDTILVATDGSGPAERGVDLALDLGAKADLTVLGRHGASQTGLTSGVSLAESSTVTTGRSSSSDRRSVRLSIED